MTTPTLLQAAQKLQEVLHELCVEDYIEEILQEHLQKYGENYRSDRLARYRDEKLTYCNAMSEFIGAIEREKAKPQDVTEVINDLTPTRIRCANCKFEHYDKLEAPCLPCRFYSNWEQKP